MLPRAGVLGALAVAATGAASLLKPAAASAATGSSTPNVLATVAEAAAIVSGDTAWVLTSTALVLFMTIPGLSLFYGGLVRQKNVVSVLTQCFATTALVTVLWTVVGYSLAFSSTGMQAGLVGVNAFIGGLDKAFLSGVTVDSIFSTIPEPLWFMFQMTFAIITPALMVGAFAERMKFNAMMMFVALWLLAVYCPAAHMVWGGAGSYFGDRGVMDFAGGIVVHITAGIAALVACIMVGPRKENVMRPHNLAMTIMGTGMLWVGWYGFNAGSALSAGAGAAMAMAVTQVSAATAALVWLLLDLQDPAVGKPSSLGICTGAVAGLAAITPAAGWVGIPGALAIGAVSAGVCRLFATRVKTSLRYDDSLDVFGVHGVGGFVGSMLVSVFASPEFGGRQLGHNIAAQLAIQGEACALVALYTLVASWAILKVTEAVCGGLRVEDKAEVLGLDSTSHGEQGYELAPPAKLLLAPQ